MFKKIRNTVLVAAVAATVAPSVFAADAAAWDYSTLTSSIDFSTIGLGVLAVAAALAAVYAGIKGAKIVLAFLR